MKLKEFIKAIRNCKTAKDERSVVSKESALIRNAFKVIRVYVDPGYGYFGIQLSDQQMDLLK
jgi:hypothetical protein